MRALCLLLVATPAFAGNNEISVGPTDRALRASSADAVTANSLSGGNVTYARALDVATLPDVSLWAEGSFDSGATTGTMFQTLHTELGALSLTAAGRARYALHDRVFACARVAVGTARASLTIRDDMGRSASDHGWGAIIAGSLGLEARIIAQPRFGLGVRAELGYVETAPIGLVAHADSASNGTLMLAGQDASLGHLDLSGPAFAFAFVAQF